MVIWLVDCFYINGCLYIYRCLYILYIFQAGTGFTPAGIIDLARPHTPIHSRLNYFSYCLRPAVLRASCLTFGVTPACPMVATQWLTNLAGTGFTPAGIIDLARPQTPKFLAAAGIACKESWQWCRENCKDSLQITSSLNYVIYILLFNIIYFYLA